jgi:hypothetical protein
MSDPNQTANEVAKITQAWREDLAEEAAKRPVTCLEQRRDPRWCPSPLGRTPKASRPGPQSAQP